MNEGNLNTGAGDSAPLTTRGREVMREPDKALSQDAISLNRGGPPNRLGLFRRRTMRSVFIDIPPLLWANLEGIGRRRKKNCASTNVMEPRNDENGAISEFAVAFFAGVPWRFERRSNIDNDGGFDVLVKGRRVSVKSSANTGPIHLIVQPNDYPTVGKCEWLSLVRVLYCRAEILGFISAKKFDSISFLREFKDGDGLKQCVRSAVLMPPAEWERLVAETKVITDLI